MTMNDSQNADNAQASSGDIGIVYVLTNPAMPGLVKIGKTSQSEVSGRISQLYTTGVPLPFDCEYAVTVKDTLQVERALHFAFGPNRLNLNREFFEIDAEQAKVILDLIKIDDVTPGVEQDTKNIDPLDKNASEKFKSRRPYLNFGDLGIPLGSVLTFSRDENTTVTVVDNKNKVNYEGDEYPFSQITATLLDWKYRYASPLPHWTYEGRILKEISDEVYGY